MKTATQVLGLVRNDTFNCLLDSDRRVAAALAAGSVEVDGLTRPQVNEAICLLCGAGYVESIGFTPCFSHPPVAPDNPGWEPEDSLCGMHTLRFGDVETPWTFCRQSEVLSFDQACREYRLTPEEYIAILVAAGDLIEHPGGGWIPGPLVDVEPDDG